MDDNDLKLQLSLANHDAKKFSEKIGLAKHLATLAAGVFAIWVIFENLYRVLYGQGAKEIAAYAKVIEAIQLGTWVTIFYGVGVTYAWKRERVGKKRAIREKNRYQRIAEKSDAYRPSSGLTETGDTPEED